MRTKLVTLLLSIFMATMVVVPSQAQVPGSEWWIYDGDSLYAKIPGVWVTGDSLHFKFGAFDSLSVIKLDSLDWFYVDTLTTDSIHTRMLVTDTIDSDHSNIVQMSGDSLDLDHIRLGVNLLGTGAYADLDSIQSDHYTGTNMDLSGWLNADSIDSDHGNIGILDSDSIESRAGNFTGNVRVADTTFCDYYEGLSPMHFLSPSHFGYIKADTIDAFCQLAPFFSGTDFSNTENYWDIIAGPDSLEWDITNNIYATLDFPLAFVIDETDTMFVFFQEALNASSYRLLRGTSVGWSSLGVIGGGGYINGDLVAMCRGGGDTLFVAFGNGLYAQCMAVWDGSSFSAIDTVMPSNSEGGYNLDIARESDGTLHYIGQGPTYGIVYKTGSLGNWSAPDTVATTIHYTYGASLVLDGSDPHIFAASTANQFNEYHSPAGGWNTTLLAGGGNTMVVGDATISSSSVIYCTLGFRTAHTQVYSNEGGWGQLGGNFFTMPNENSYPQIALNSLGMPVVAEQDNANGIGVVVWTGSIWDDISPSSGDGAQIVDIAFDSDDNIHIVTRNGANDYLLYGTRQMDPGLNTGHRNGALLIRTNVQNDAADIYIHTDSTMHLESDSLIVPNIAIFDSTATIQTADIDSTNTEHLVVNTTAAFGGVSDFDVGITLAEITTPGALASHGKVYTKADGHLYFLDRADVEQLVTLGSSDYGEMGNVYGSSATEIINNASQWHGMYHANITGAAPHLNSGFTFTAGSAGAGNITTAQGGAGINIADAAHGLVDGDIICVQSANHAGVDTVTYVDADNFEITIAFVGNEAGTWQEGSYLTVGTTGIYRGMWTGMISQDDNAVRINVVAPYVNTTQSAKAVCDITLINNTEHKPIGGNGLMNFAVGDRIWFACQSADPQTLTFIVRNVTIR